MSAQTFTVTLSPEQFETLSAKLKGLNLGKNYLQFGTLPETRGVVLSYSVSMFATGMAAVTFTVKKKPFLVPVNAIRAEVKKQIGDGFEQT